MKSIIRNLMLVSIISLIPSVTSCKKNNPQPESKPSPVSAPYRSVKYQIIYTSPGVMNTRKLTYTDSDLNSITDDAVFDTTYRYASVQAGRYIYLTAWASSSNVTDPVIVDVNIYVDNVLVSSNTDSGPGYANTNTSVTVQ